MDNEPALEYLFHPKTIAVVGASSDPSNYFGYVYMAALSQFGENLYPVNPRRTEIHGLKAYPTLTDIPVPIDYVVCSIPAAQVPELIEESSTKGARVVQISSAGFSEAGDEQGAHLEKELVETARRVGVRIIGPNCMGLYCPSAGLSYNSTFSRESGAVGYLSQSGGQTTYMVNHGTFRGIRFSKAISYGNACDLNESDFLDYFADDPETKVISSYVEGTTDGQRLLKALEKASRVKPVIVCKGGQTDAGIRAVAGHTGALAGSKQTWEAAFRQSGVVQASSIEEMADVLLAFLRLRTPAGRRVGIVGVGGGASVQAADECEKAGLVVPMLPVHIREELMEFTPQAGSSVRNPVDTTVVGGLRLFSRTLELIAGCDDIDLMIIFHVLDWSTGSPYQEQQQQLEPRFAENLAIACKMIDKPVAVCIVSSGAPQLSNAYDRVHHQCVTAGFPVYPTVGRAAHAINSLIDYHEVQAAAEGTHEPFRSEEDLSLAGSS